jgi:hypothetical protein
MRSKRFLIGACAVAASIAIPSTAFGAAAAIQTIDGQVGGKETPKFDKKKFKATKIYVKTTTADAASATAMPPKASRAVIVFDKKSIKFDPDAAPGCAQSSIANTTTDAAKAACGSAQVGAGQASAALPFGTGGTRQDFPVTVTAFNNGDADGILLHSRAEAPLNTTTVLVGTLSGTTLDVAIPPLGGGVGAISSFETTVQEGKYVQARCKTKKIKYDSEFTYTDTPSATAQDSQKCKQKKKKKGNK